jgi:hypothetical protein
LELYFVKAYDNACGMKLPIPSHGKIWDNKLVHFYDEIIVLRIGTTLNLNGIITKDFDIRRGIR